MLYMKLRKLVAFPLNAACIMENLEIYGYRPELTEWCW